MANTLDELLLEDMVDTVYLNTIDTTDGDLIDSLEDTDPDNYTVNEKGNLAHKNSIYEFPFQWSGRSFI